MSHRLTDFYDASPANSPKLQRQKLLQHSAKPQLAKAAPVYGRATTAASTTELSLPPNAPGMPPLPSSTRSSATSSPVSPVISRATAAGYSATLSLSDASAKLKAAGRMCGPVSSSSSASSSSSSSSSSSVNGKGHHRHSSSSVASTPIESVENSPQDSVVRISSPIPVVLSPVPLRQSSLTSPVGSPLSSSPPSSLQFIPSGSTSNSRRTAIPKTRSPMGASVSTPALIPVSVPVPSRSSSPHKTTPSPGHNGSSYHSNHHHGYGHHHASSSSMSAAASAALRQQTISPPGGLSTSVTFGSRGGGLSNRYVRGGTVNTNSNMAISTPGTIPAAEALIRQVFLPREPANVDWRVRLPSLSRFDGVNVELYALIAVLCRTFVLSWYGSIVDDAGFLRDIAQTVAECTRRVEERLLRTDTYSLLLDELPLLLEMHVRDLRMVRARMGSAVLPRDSEEAAFHAVRPLPALDSPEDESLFLKVLAKGLVVSLLGEKDAMSPVARTLVASIIETVGLAGTVEKLSEPWMIYDMITKLLDAFVPLTDDSNSNGGGNGGRGGGGSGGGGRSVNTTINETSVAKLEWWPVSQQAGVLYGRVVSYCGALVTAGGRWAAFVLSFAGGDETSLERARVPVVASGVFSCANAMLRVSTQRPLLAAAVRVLSSPFAFGRLRKVANRITAHGLERYLTNAGTMTAVIRAARMALFSEEGTGPMNPGRVPPDEEEKKQIRASAMRSIYLRVPDHVRGVLFGDDTRNGVYEMLDLFGNKQVNKHLIYSIIDHLVTTLVPELTESTPQELLDEIKVGKGK
ncbi:uncharacterized protein SAPINGB_P001790 [Magnusiomyces paraingens]|uniref:PXA domain-containing protein n=1 Tax=Magnusiomyces paraingens TaxID=2606893 RepID=A0A5E8BI94_9ASCO|nr:uncharacterized protein SAPINGB_P001790 [Saprochaete ingens]VVT48460.1 unnamed protein product [Saprochaete ingens]